MTFRSRIPPTVAKISSRVDIFTVAPDGGRKRSREDGYGEFRRQFARIYDGLGALQTAAEECTMVQCWPDETAFAFGSARLNVREDVPRAVSNDDLATALETLSIGRTSPTSSVIEDFIDAASELSLLEAGSVKSAAAAGALLPNTHGQRISRRLARMVGRIQGRRVEPKRSPADVFRDVLAEACFQRDFVGRSALLERYYCKDE